MMKDNTYWYPDFRDDRTSTPGRKATTMTSNRGLRLDEVLKMLGVWVKRSYNDFCKEVDINHLINGSEQIELLLKTLNQIRNVCGRRNRNSISKTTRIHARKRKWNHIDGTQPILLVTSEEILLI